MFLQVMTGETSDAEGIHRLMDRWVELSRAASGWLGSTTGVTDDGKFVAAGRFTSAEDAQRNSDNEAQEAWFAELVKHLDGEPQFKTYSDVETMLAGGSDDAGFVQVIEARVLDAQAVRATADALDAAGDAIARPDLIGGIAGISDDGSTVIQMMYFTSEEDARKGEAAEPPPEFVEAMSAWQEATADTRYLDLRDPWMASPS